jgi:hypothetical protein
MRTLKIAKKLAKHDSILNARVMAKIDEIKLDELAD